MDEIRRHWVSLTVAGIVWFFAWAYLNTSAGLELLPAFLLSGVMGLMTFAKAANR